MNPEEERELFQAIRKSNKKAFEKLFHIYYGYLCSYALKIIQNDNAAEEIVQDFFVMLWEKREQINVETSVKNYLFRSVKNRTLNELKHNKIKTNYAQSVLSEIQQNTDNESSFYEIDLAEKIEESIRLLPGKRREIFRLSREEGLRYREIAKQLNISVKTVETQMSLALKFLREKLKNFNTFFVLFSLFYKK